MKTPDLEWQGRVLLFGPASANVNTQTPLNSEIVSNSGQHSKEVLLECLCVLPIVAVVQHHLVHLGVCLGSRNSEPSGHATH